MGNSFVNGLVVEGQSCHERSSRLSAAMHPSGVAAPHSAHGQPSQLPKVVAAPLHGGPLFVTGAHLQLVAVEGANCPGVGHSHSSKSLSHASTSAARLKHRTKSACSAWSAHSSSFIRDSLCFVRSDSIGRFFDHKR